MNLEYRVINRKLLIVEDNRKLLEGIAAHFRAAKNDVTTIETLKDARSILERTGEAYDAIILDRQLPDGSGLELFNDFKQLPPVVILSALGSEDQIVEGLKTGALDYIVKPCAFEHLEIRVALRLLPPAQATLVFDDFNIDTANRVVTFKGTPIALTSSEFNILNFLARHPGEFFTTGVIYERVWGLLSLNTTTVKRHLCTLRQKLKAVSPCEELVVTEFGKGYSMPKRG